MNKYEKLLNEATNDGVKVIENFNFKSGCRGMIRGNKIALSRKIPTRAEKAAILAEELGHYHTAEGRLIEQSSVFQRKRELYGRSWGYNRLIGLRGLIAAYNDGCKSRHEIAEYLDVPEWYLADALEYYRGKHGKRAIVDNYVVYFEPYIGVLELI